MKQHTKLLLGFIFGVTFGLIGYYYLPAKEFTFMTSFSEVMTFLGATFLRMIFMVVVPLILSALMLGTMELGKGAGLGKVGGLSLLYTLMLSGCAVIIAVVMTNILKPGVGLAFDKAALATNSGVLTLQSNAKAAQGKMWYQYIVDLMPQNPIDSAAKAFSGEIVALMIFALFFGWALSTVIKDDDHPMAQVLDSIFQASMKIIELAMKLAPYAIFGIVFNTAYKMGASFLGNVAYYALVAYPVLRGLWTSDQDACPDVAFWLLRSVQGGLSLRLHDGLVQCHPAGCAGVCRTRSETPAPHLALRADRRRLGQPERYRAL